MTKRRTTIQSSLEDVGNDLTWESEVQLFLDHLKVKGLSYQYRKVAQRESARAYAPRMASP